MNIFITGISGFIGFHLAKYLKRKGYAVTGCDNFNNYYDIKLKKERTKILKKQKIKIFNLDITKKNKLIKIFNQKKVTHLINLAAQAGVRYSIKNPNAYVHSNLLGFVSLLEAAKNTCIKKILFASSSSVYGNNKEIFKLKDNTDRPTNLYGATKKANELIAYSYHNLYKIPFIGLRFFTVYGEFGRPDMAYFKFAKKIIKNEPIELYNFGNMQRDFTYIEDILESIKNALFLEKEFAIFNLGSNHPRKLLDLVDLLEKNLDKKANKKLVPMPKAEIIKTYADISLSKKDLNFNPTTSLEEGIEKFVFWFKKYYKVT